MPLSSAASGTQTATLGTEHTLATITTNGSYVLGVDTGALANGETLELFLKTRMLSAGTSRIAWSVSYANAQGDPQKYSIPVPSDVEIVATLRQTGGTGRAFPWKLFVL